VLLSQAWCAKCGKPLNGDVEWNHALAHAIGGSDGPENIEAIHTDCHKIETNGTKATTAGSTKQVVAKVKRLRGETGQGSATRKIRSRGFPKPPPGYKHNWPSRKVGQ